MRKDLSIVKVDTRHHRVIAQENWGLTDEQMEGIHVHHRILRSAGGTNDPCNLYVCSPSFHKYAWHDGKEWVSWASEGAKKGAEKRRYLWINDEEWASRMREMLSQNALKSHAVKDADYSERQSKKALQGVCSKRKWDKETYEQVFQLYFEGFTSGYKIAKRMGVSKWKPIANMMNCVSLGLTFEQATTTELYVQEMDRINSSPVSHLIEAYK